MIAPAAPTTLRESAAVVLAPVHDTAGYPVATINATTPDAVTWSIRTSTRSITIVSAEEYSDLTQALASVAAVTGLTPTALEDAQLLLAEGAAAVLAHRGAGLIRRTIRIELVR